MEIGNQLSQKKFSGGDKNVILTKDLNKSGKIYEFKYNFAL
jgi:hypothetical protein